jgi:hypothetical protein
MAKAILAVYIDAGRTTNGNPRRGWIIFGQNGEFIEFVDEEYLGSSALDRAGFKGIHSTGRIPTTASIYRQLKKGETV